MSSQDTHAHHTLDPLMDATFNEPSMQERVELIIHLLRHSDRVFTIMSDDATVLSGFSHKLTHHDTQGLHYAEVYPSAGMDAEDIVMHLARAWGVEVDFGDTAMNALFQRLPASLTDPRRAVAIIHFADILPPMILDGLIGFMQRLDQLLDGRVRLILTGSSQLTQRIAPMQTLGEAGQVYALHLQALATGAPASQGFVSAAAAEVLAPSDTETKSNSPSSVSERSPSTTSSSSAARGLIFGGLGISLILAVVVAIMLRPDVPEAPKDTTVSIPLMPPLAPSTTSETVPAPDATVDSADQTTAAMPATEVVATPALPAQPSTPKPGLTQPSVYFDAPPKVNEAAPVVSAAPVQAVIKPAPTLEKEAKLATKAKATLPTSDRFSAENASQYVLQVVTLGSSKAANSFIKTHGLEDCQTFRQQRDGKELFSLTCGLYPSREAALAAQSKLPSSVKAAKPYPRQVADIRKVMLP
ncbi:MAG TPA: hypothetical protein ENO09_00625 [bacterium]|nr:hypothetical protein [bacterium]